MAENNAANLSDAQLIDGIEDLTGICENLDFENSIFEQYLVRVQGQSVELPQMLDDEQLQTMYQYDPNQTGMVDVAFAILSSKNINTSSPGTTSQASKRSKQNSTSSSMQASTNLPSMMYRLTAEQKCDIANREIEEITTKMDVVKQDSDRVLDNYRANLEELELKQKDINKALTDFERDMKNSIIERSKKYQAEKVQRYFDEKKRAKEALVKKLRLKTATMSVQKKKVSLQLKQKEEMGEVLHEVDFNQLKIENQQYLERIDEKNQELLTLKSKATNTTVYLNGKKRHMQELTEKIAFYNQEFKLRTDTCKKLDEETVRVQEEVKEAKQNLDKLKRKMEDYDVPPTKDYIQQKSKLDELRIKAKTWMRKVEIAEMKLKSVRNNWMVLCSKQQMSQDSNNSQMLSNSSNANKSAITT